MVTAVLNPWDRALYLAMVRQTCFFDRSNWRQPYRGVFQTIVQRGLSSGLYFPLEEACSRWTGSAAAGGQLAGVINGALLNPIALVKHQNWGAKEGASFLQTSTHLYQHSGLKVFSRGITATIFRDAIFGLCFSFRKTMRSPGQDERTTFMGSMAFAALGTVLSSPFNYIRNVTYASILATDAPTTRSLRSLVEATLREFVADARKQDTGLKAAHFIQERLKLGWGTARVAVGMAMVDLMYRSCCTYFNDGG